MLEVVVVSGHPQRLEGPGRAGLRATPGTNPQRNRLAKQFDRGSTSYGGKMGMRWYPLRS